METISRTEAAVSQSAQLVPGVGIVVLITIPRVTGGKEQRTERKESPSRKRFGMGHTESWPQAGHPWTGAEGYDS